MKINTNFQQYNINWSEVINNTNNAVNYQIDTNNDGLYDMQSYFNSLPKIENETGSISGYVKSSPSNAGWKVCIDTNNNNDCEENIEPFNVTNNAGYYEFNGLTTGTYNIKLIPHKNWILTNPISGIYTITLSNGQVITNNNFGAYKTKLNK